MVKERYLKVANLNDGVGKKIVEALKKQSTGEVDATLSQPAQVDEQFNTGLGIDISALDSFQSNDISTRTPVEDFSAKQIPNFDDFFNDEEYVKHIAKKITSKKGVSALYIYKGEGAYFRKEQVFDTKMSQLLSDSLSLQYKNEYFAIFTK